MTQELEYSEFIANEKDKRAATRSLEIIGEAIKNLPDELRNEYKDVEWRSAAGLRDRLIHGYYRVDYKIIWNVIKQDIPYLKQQIKTIIADTEE